MSMSVGIDNGNVVKCRRWSHSSSNVRVMKVVRVLGDNRGPLGLDDDTLELGGTDECVIGMGAQEGGRGGRVLWKRVDLQ